jgi:hypothetical protein
MVCLFTRVVQNGEYPIYSFTPVPTVALTSPLNAIEYKRLPEIKVVSVNFSVKWISFVHYHVYFKTRKSSIGTVSYSGILTAQFVPLTVLS